MYLSRLGMEYLGAIFVGDGPLAAYLPQDVWGLGRCDIRTLEYTMTELEMLGLLQESCNFF